LKDRLRRRDAGIWQSIFVFCHQILSEGKWFAQKWKSPLPDLWSKVTWNCRGRPGYSMRRSSSSNWHNSRRQCVVASSAESPSLEQPSTLLYNQLGWQPSSHRRTPITKYVQVVCTKNFETLSKHP